MTNRLFVYGSLRSLGGAFDRLLADAALGVHDAVLPDHALYGWGLAYPFVRERVGSAVVGEMVEIDPVRIADVIRAVDEYEGSDYRRVEVEIDADGNRVIAYVYVAESSVELGDANHVESGDWMRPF